MVLIVEGQKYACANDLASTYTDCISSIESIRVAAATFRSNSRVLSSDADLLYVHQGEMATVAISGTSTTPYRSPRMIASDDATSCLIVALRLPKFGIIAHLDSPERARSFFSRISEQLASVADEGPIHVHLVGGFTDERQLGRRLVTCVMQQLLCTETQIYELKTFCVMRLNVTNKPAIHRHRTITTGLPMVPVPAVTGMFLDCTTGIAAAATVTWEARGPVPALRLARLRDPNSWTLVYDVFDTMTGTLVIEPFTYDSDLRFDPRRLSRDAMRCFSTTPDQEPCTFFNGLRASLCLVYEHPNPMRSWFSTGSLRFALCDPTDSAKDASSETSWKPLNASSASAATLATVTSCDI